jgi:hypothetical protein
MEEDHHGIWGIAVDISSNPPNKGYEKCACMASPCRFFG